MIKELLEGRLGERPSFDETFMVKAIVNARRSSCHNVHAGSVLVDIEDKNEIGGGYNGAPPREKSCLQAGYCEKERATKQKYGEVHGTGTCIGVHSEVNALAHITKLAQVPFALYATIFPCNDCLGNLLAHKKFKKLVFKSEYSKKDGTERKLKRLDDSGVQVLHLDLSPERFIDIYWNEPDAKFTIWSPEQRVRIAGYLEKISLKQPE